MMQGASVRLYIGAGVNFISNCLSLYFHLSSNISVFPYLPHHLRLPPHFISYTSPSPWPKGDDKFKKQINLDHQSPILNVTLPLEVRAVLIKIQNVEEYKSNRCIPNISPSPCHLYWFKVYFKILFKSPSCPSIFCIGKEWGFCTVNI